MTLIESNQHFLISSHINPDGDAIGSALAFKRLLEKLGKTGRWVMDDDPGDAFVSFYQKDELEVYDSNTSSWHDCDVIVILDAAVWKRLGDVGDSLARHPAEKLCIDHHESAEAFDGLKICDVVAPSTTVILYRIIQQLGVELTFDLAEPIYLGLIVDTQNFHLPNTTVESHTIAAHCLNAGVQPDKVYEPVFGTTSFARLCLMSQAFKTVEVICGGRVSLMHTSLAMFEHCGAKLADDEGFSDLVRTIEGVKAGIYIRELEPDKVKVSWRGKSGVNVEASARRFGGGGHIGAAGAQLHLPLAPALQAVRDEITQRWQNGEI